MDEMILLCKQDEEAEISLRGETAIRGNTRHSIRVRVIPVLWLSFVRKWGVGEVGHT